MGLYTESNGGDRAVWSWYGTCLLIYGSARSQVLRGKGVLKVRERVSSLRCVRHGAYSRFYSQPREVEGSGGAELGDPRQNLNLQVRSYV